MMKKTLLFTLITMLTISASAQVLTAFQEDWGDHELFIGLAYIGESEMDQELAAHFSIPCVSLYDYATLNMGFMFPDLTVDTFAFTFGASLAIDQIIPYKYPSWLTSRLQGFYSISFEEKYVGASLDVFRLSW